MIEYDFRVEALLENGKKDNTFFKDEREAWGFSTILSKIGIDSIVYGKTLK